MANNVHVLFENRENDCERAFAALFDTERLWKILRSQLNIFTKKFTIMRSILAKDGWSGSL